MHHLLSISGGSVQAVPARQALALTVGEAGGAAATAGGSARTASGSDRSQVRSMRCAILAPVVGGYLHC